MFKLLQKHFRWYWSNECQQAFEALKNRLATAPVLAFPNFSKPFILATDAADTGLGATLSQESDEGIRKLVACASRTLTKSERNYHVTEKEALGIVWALKTFRPYLLGQTIEIYTDHQPLKWLLSTQQPSGRLQRWALQVAEFQPNINY